MVMYLLVIAALLTAIGIHLAILCSPAFSARLHRTSLHRAGIQPSAEPTAGPRIGAILYAIFTLLLLVRLLVWWIDSYRQFL